MVESLTATVGLTAAAAAARRESARWQKNCFQFLTEQLAPRLPLCEAAEPVGAVWHRGGNTVRPSSGSDRHNLFIHGHRTNKIISNGCAQKLKTLTLLPLFHLHMCDLTRQTGAGDIQASLCSAALVGERLKSANRPDL